MNNLNKTVKNVEVVQIEDLEFERFRLDLLHVVEDLEPNSMAISKIIC